MKVDEELTLCLAYQPRGAASLCDAAVASRNGTGIATAPRSPITAALQPFVDSHSLAGAVTLVADKDQVLSLDAVGYADIAAGKPMAADALFWIASQSKPITATAFMMLVDEGKVSLDDPVEKFLPEFHGQWLAVGAGQRSCPAEEAQASDHGPRHPQPHQRPAVRVGRGTAHARPAAASRGCPDLRDVTRSSSSRAASISTRTPASTPRAGSSRWSAACPTRSSSTRGCFGPWA